MKHISTTLLAVPALILIAGIAYSDDSIEEWVSFYDGPANSDDLPFSIAVDDSGNVYVTGRSRSGPEYETQDFATIKYNSNGVQQWASRYNGPGDSLDQARKIVVDDSGNVYVAGHSRSGPEYGTEDFATIKYNSYGVPQWVARYNGPGDGEDSVFDLALDAEGNVYVTGRSPSGSGNSTRDCTTIKYNSSGVEQWVARYNGPANSSDMGCAIIVDENGNAFVTGSRTTAGTNTDFVTIKYNSDGEEQWVACYDGPGASPDLANDIVLDSNGNIIVTGNSQSSSSTYSMDYATVKYNSAGVEQWVSRYNGPGNDMDACLSMVIDSDENAYVTGWSRSGTSTESTDYATVKYNSDGEEQWVARYNGPGNTYDGAVSISLDVFSNVYVTGGSWNGSTIETSDVATVKYNSGGEQLWVVRYDGPEGLYDFPYDNAVDLEGNVYTTSTTTTSAESGNYVTVKYGLTVEVAHPQEIELSHLHLLPISPNPNTGNFTIGFYTPQASELTLEIYDISGRLVQPSIAEVYSAGIHQIGMGDLSPGVYLCRLANNSISISEKFVVVR